MEILCVRFSGHEKTITSLKVCKQLIAFRIFQAVREYFFHALFLEIDKKTVEIRERFLYNQSIYYLKLEAERIRGKR